jgi:hypothetical protein
VSVAEWGKAESGRRGAPEDRRSFLYFAQLRLGSESTRSEQPVAGVAETGHDVALLVERAVE